MFPKSEGIFISCQGAFRGSVLGVLLQILPTSDFLGWQRGKTWEMEEVPGYGVYVAGRAMGSLASINDLLVLTAN